MHYLDFEKPISELEGKIEELRHLSGAEEFNIVDEVTILQNKVDKLLEQIYSNLTPWQKTLVARHPDRPHALDYIKSIISDFTPLAGDRLFGEDEAIIGGIGRFDGRSVVVIGTEKGFDTESRVKHNFGMARPEGYRKAQRLMVLAQKFNLPIITNALSLSYIPTSVTLIGAAPTNVFGLVILLVVLKSSADILILNIVLNIVAPMQVSKLP